MAGITAITAFIDPLPVRRSLEESEEKRALLDKAVQKEHSDLGKRTEKAHIAVLNKALSDQRVLYAQKIEQECDLANEVLRKACEENYDNIKNERQKFDYMTNQARAQLIELENERSKLKSLIESLIQQQEVRGKMNVEDVVMKFKVHKVKELYSDLQKYDLQGELREFSIVRPAITVKFATFTEALRWHGYIRDVEVYYFNPAPWSELSTLIKEN
ncbi:unnamed protein product [Miscanthus lutarioriparius]|uniref:Uncharacterized protein n=1 Tax=Miscanthus lutarioriparius TaxID=422564 RepID=A0A811RAD9_9POAL|nr:unnamed protein product [Miscanthus lutarioriparius]